MTTPKYNPAFMDPEKRALRFAGREHDLAELLRAARENIRRDHNQHVLVLGSRGMGKTTLLLRTADVVREEKSLESVWFPIVAPEELYQAGSLGEVWLEMVLQLANTTGDERHQRAYGALKSERDNTRLAASALAHLLDFADSQHRRLLLVLENLHMLFDEQLDEKDAWAFREVLLHEPRIMVLASSVTVFTGLHQPDAALYELFQLHPLEPLDRQGCMALWKAVTGSEIPERRMRALEILTGGNPRLLTILADFASQRSLAELSRDLADLIDEHTDYLKMTTEALPPLERKVFVSLAQIWEEAPASRVAEESRLDLNVASSQLTRLESRGFVLSRKQGRGKVYRLAERMYSLYHLMRRHGGSAARAKAAVEFMAFYYGPDTLIHQAQDLCKDISTLPPDQREDCFHILTGLLECRSLLRHRPVLADQIPDLLVELPDAPESFRRAIRKAKTTSQKKETASEKKLAKLMKQVEKAVASGDPQERASIRETLKTFGDEAAKVWYAFGEALQKAGLHGEAEEGLKQAIAIGRARLSKGEEAWRFELWRAMFSLARTQRKLHHLETALITLQKALEVSAAYQDSENFLRLATGMGTHTLMAECYKEMSQSKEALVHAREAVTLCRRGVENNPDSFFVEQLPNCLDILAKLLAAEGQVSEAQDVIKESVDRWRSLENANPGKHTAHFAKASIGLAKMLVEQKLFREALTVILESETSIRNLGTNLSSSLEMMLAMSLALKATCQVGIGDKMASVSSARESLVIIRRIATVDPEFNPVFHESLRLYALALGYTGKSEEAIAAFCELLERDAGNLNARSELVPLLLETGQSEEAAKHFCAWVQHKDVDKKKPETLVQPALRLTHAGFGQEVLDALTESPLAPRLEPLLVALRKYLNQETRSPELIEAIAEDIVQDINAMATDTKTKRT